MLWQMGVGTSGAVLRNPVTFKCFIFSHHTNIKSINRQIIVLFPQINIFGLEKLLNSSFKSLL